MGIKAATNVEIGKIEIQVINGQMSMSYSLSPEKAKLFAETVTALADVMISGQPQSEEDADVDYGDFRDRPTQSFQDK